MDSRTGRNRDTEYSPQFRWVTNSRPEGNKDREYSPQPDSSPGYQEEVLMAMAARNKDAADMQAQRRTESETDAWKRTILSLPKVNSLEIQRKAQRSGTWSE